MNYESCRHKEKVLCSHCVLTINAAQGKVIENLAKRWDLMYQKADKFTRKKMEEIETENPVI